MVMFWIVMVSAERIFPVILLALFAVVGCLCFRLGMRVAGTVQRHVLKIVVAALWVGKRAVSVDSFEERFCL
jgi:hypothetical protein